MSSEGVFSRAMSGVNQARKVASDYAGPAVETTVELTKRATQVVKEAIPPAIKLAEEAAATGATLAGQAASAASQGAASARDTFLAYHTAHVQPMLSSGMAYSVAVMGTSGVYLKQAMFYSIGYMEQVSVQAWDFTGQFLAKSYKSFLLLTNEMQEIAFDEFLRRNQITILTSAGALTFAALLLRGLKPSTARVLDGPKDTVSVQEAQEKSMEAFAAFKRAGIRGGDCIVAAVGAVQAVELAVWCRAYNAPLYVTNPWADAALIKKLLQEHSPRVFVYDWAGCGAAVAEVTPMLIASGTIPNCTIVHVTASAAQAASAAKKRSDHVGYDRFLAADFKQVEMPWLETSPAKTATEKSISGSRASPAADLGNMVTDIAGSISDQLSNLFGGGSPANVPDASDDGKGTRKRAQVLL